MMSGPLEPTNEAYAIAKIATAGLAGMYRRQFGMDYVTVVPDQPLRTRRQFRSDDEPRRARR